MIRPRHGLACCFVLALAACPRSSEPAVQSGEPIAQQASGDERPVDVTDTSGEREALASVEAPASTAGAETPGAEAASPVPVPDPEGVRRAGDAIEVEPAFRFEIDDDELRAESLPTLDALATFLRNHPDIVRLEVQGHTDDRGLEVGRPLGMARATTIVEGLVARGVDGARLYACGYGALRPRVSGTSQVARAANRRIELVVRAEGATCNPQAP